MGLSGYGATFLAATYDNIHTKNATTNLQWVAKAVEWRPYAN